MTFPIQPGIGPTIYGNLPHDIDHAAALIPVADLVCLHTSADVTDVASAARVRSLGCQRVWLGVPANYFVSLAKKKSLEAAKVEARRVANIALGMAAEVLEFNGEGESSGKTPGDWIPADPQEAVALADLAAAIIDAALEVLNGRVLVSWTSHDMPSFRLPWKVILARVALHSPQHYPAFKDHVVTQAELASRITNSGLHWHPLVDRGQIPADVAPCGAKWTPYLQGWGHSVGAMTWGLTRAAIVRQWAFPGSWSPQAIQALKAAKRLRVEAGFGVGSVERYQSLHGLKPDGDIGPKTLASLGIS